MNRIAAAVACLLTAALRAACSGHNAGNARGEPVLLSNGFDGNGAASLSFERNVASMAFLPI